MDLGVIETRYYPQYRRWGLFWVSIPGHIDYFHKENDAHLAIKRYARLKEMKDQSKTRIIYIDDDCLATVHKTPGVFDD